MKSYLVIVDVWFQNFVSVLLKHFNSKYFNLWTIRALYMDHCRHIWGGESQRVKKIWGVFFFIFVTN